MKERIVKFIEEKKITAAEFADHIGVQRSSVSHVLNGRNNPGFSFIQKIIEAYPEINSRWLLTGEGKMMENKHAGKASEEKNNNLFSTAGSMPEERSYKHSESANNQVIESGQEATSNTQAKASEKQAAKKVIRVLIFYDDQSFEDFHPSK